MQPIRILVIDDEPLICKGCCLILGDDQQTVDACLTGRDGLAALCTETYDLVLLDMKLPDMDGLEILKEARKAQPGSYVIVMTGYSTVQNAIAAMKAGAFDYLTKPFTDDELLFAVRKAVEKKRLAAENLALRQELFQRFRFENIVGEDPQILQIFAQIEKVAPLDSTVLLYGESGTGKELFAGAVYARSQRAARQFIAVDCSTLSPTLLESELFGHVRGAFTGAFRDKEGLFAAASGGTLFMDDVTNLSLEIQGKLLRVIECGEYKPVGASHFSRADIRIIAATNRDLRGMVEAGSFREDLFYRLNVFPIYLPPLRERKADIPKLAYHFLKRFCHQTGKRIEGFSADALETLIDYEWPGNVRQLKNVVERLVIMADEPTLELPYLSEQLPMHVGRQTDRVPETLAELKAGKQRLLEEVFGRLQKAFLLKALRACEGNITLAAARVGMQRPNFCELLKKHHISAQRIKDEPRSNSGLS